jgi:hypothetical protein
MGRSSLGADLGFVVQWVQQNPCSNRHSSLDGIIIVEIGTFLHKYVCVTPGCLGPLHRLAESKSIQVNLIRFMRHVGMGGFASS